MAKLFERENREKPLEPYKREYVAQDSVKSELSPLRLKLLRASVGYCMCSEDRLCSRCKRYIKIAEDLQEENEFLKKELDRADEFLKHYQNGDR